MGRCFTEQLYKRTPAATATQTSANAAPLPAPLADQVTPQAEADEDHTSALEPGTSTLIEEGDPRPTEAVQWKSPVAAGLAAAWRPVEPTPAPNAHPVQRKLSPVDKRAPGHAGAAVLTADNFRRDLTVEPGIRSIRGGSYAIAAPTRQ